MKSPPQSIVHQKKCERKEKREVGEGKITGHDLPDRHSSCIEKGQKEVSQRRRPAKGRSTKRSRLIGWRKDFFQGDRKLGGKGREREKV